MDPLSGNFSSKHLRKIEEIRKIASSDLFVACGQFQNYCNSNPSDYDLMFSFAKFLRDFNQTSNAIKVAMYIRERTGNESITLLGFIADLSRSTGDHLLAISTYRSILLLQPNNISASLNLSVSLALFGDIPNAIRELEKSLVTHTNNSDLLLNLGNLHYLNNDFSKSKDCHIRALMNGANESLVLVNLCQTLRKLADWELLKEYESRLSNLTFKIYRIIKFQLKHHCNVCSDVMIHHY